MCWQSILCKHYKQRESYNFINKCSLQEITSNKLRNHIFYYGNNCMHCGNCIYLIFILFGSLPRYAVNVGTSLQSRDHGKMAQRTPTTFSNSVWKQSEVATIIPSHTNTRPFSSPEVREQRRLSLTRSPLWMFWSSSMMTRLEKVRRKQWPEMSSPVHWWPACSQWGNETEFSLLF